MFTVTCKPLEGVKADLQEFGDELYRMWAGLPSLASRVVDEQRPTVQLSAHEISDEDEEEIFGYAGIPSAAGPIGVPHAIDTIELGADPRTRRLLFSLDGFYSHLHRIAPATVDAYERAGSLEAFLEEHGDSLAPKEYLAAALADVIQFCRAKNEALVIYW